MLTARIALILLSDRPTSNSSCDANVKTDDIDKAC